MITTTVPSNDSHRAAAPIRNRPSSLQLENERARAAEQARVAESAKTVGAQVQTGFRPPSGRLFSVDVEALMILGPNGGVGTTAVIARTLAPLAAEGRQDEHELAVATGWRDEGHLREGLAALAPKLAALGLRLDRRKAGIRIGKPRSRSS